MAKTIHWGTPAAAGTLVAVGLLLLMVLVVVESRPAEATFPGKSGKIAYSGYDGQDYEIYSIAPAVEVGSNSPTTLGATTSLATRQVASR